MLLSEWLVFNAKLIFFQIYHGGSKLLFDKMMISIVLVHWNKSPSVDMLLNSDTLFWFRDNQSLLLLFNAACLAEKQQTPDLYSLGLSDSG